MYLCVCHAVSDRQVKAMVQDQGLSLAAVYRELGIRPRCAACVPHIKQAVRDAQQEAAPATEPTAALPYGVAAE